MKRIVFIYLLGLTSALHAQDTTIEFNSVEVYAQRLTRVDQLISNQLWKCDPTSNIANLLQKESGIYIKSQGNAVLNTPTYQGFSATHIPIFIQGMNIQSSMNSTFDLSLLSGFHFNNFSFVESENSSLGSPNLGPGLSLNSSAKSGLEITASASTVRIYDVGIKWGRSTSNWSTQISFHSSGGPNKYDVSHYPERATSYDSKFLRNTKFLNNSVFINIRNKQAKSGYWTSNVYLGYGDRQIPESLVAINTSRQNDLNLLWGNAWRTGNQRRSLRLAHQLRQEQIDYFSDFVNTNNRSSGSNTILEGKLKVARGLTAKAGVGNELATYEVSHGPSGSSSGVSVDTFYNRTRTFTSVQYKRLKSALTVSGQAQFGIAKPEYSARLRYNVRMNSFLVTGEIGKNYRLPSLNDLYWNEPGFAMGNINLRPEKGYRVNADVAFQDKGLTIGFSPYAATNEDLILWAYNADLTLWQPINVRKVRMYGAASKVQMNAKIDGIQLTSVVRYNWNVAQYVEPGSTIHLKQLIFNPQHTWNGTIIIQRNRISGHVNMQYIGRNYTQSDNQKWLDSYLLFSGGLNFRRNKTQFGLQADNILNYAYFSIPNQPLPGRRLKLTITQKLK